MPTENLNRRYQLHWIVPLVAIIVMSFAYLIGPNTLFSLSQPVDENYFRAAVYEHRPPSLDKKMSIPVAIETNLRIYLKAIEAAAKEVNLKIIWKKINQVNT